MVREYLKMVGRRILRRKIYAVINVAGLTIAMTAALLIYCHIVKEWKTDRFHEKVGQIHRVILKDAGYQYWSAYSSYPLASYAKSEFPEIEDYVRVASRPYEAKRAGKGEYMKNKTCLFVDKQFFKVFTFPLINGDNRQDWGKDWLVITQKEARKLFGEENPVGQIMVLKSPWEGEGKEYRVVAVMKDFPAASSLQADYVIDNTDQVAEDGETWGLHGVYTYFVLNKNSNITKLEERLPELVERNYEYIKAGDQQFHLQPLKDVYFGSVQVAYDVRHGSLRMNWILGGIALLILILASGNYLMIAMAQLHTQAAGIVMQRCLGADNRHLFFRVLSEVAVYMSIALLLSGLGVIGLHPYLVEILSPGAPYELDVTFLEIAVFFLILVFSITGIGACLYFWMARRVNRHSVREILYHFSGKTDIKEILSVVQMCIFSALLFSSMVLMRQMNFVQKHDLGYDYRNVLGFGWRFDRQTDLKTVRASVLASDSDIEFYSNGHELPLSGKQEGGNYYMVNQPELKKKAYMIHGDADYLSVYRIQLVEGRNINSESYPTKGIDFLRRQSKVIPEVLVNEEFIKQFGEKDYLGAIFKSDNEYDTFRIVGVVKDFHFLPLYQAIQPMYIVYDMPFLSASVLVRYREGSRLKVVEHLKKMYEENVSGIEFSYSEYEFSQFYDRDVALGKLIHIFTLVAIAIGGMGIFAFSMFMAESRRREVALRKINGASIWQITRLLNRHFLGRTLLACAIGIPIAHYAMTQWLMGFAYKIELSVGLYLGVIFLCVAFVIGIITWQIYRTAHVNPVEVLKNE